MREFPCVRIYKKLDSAFFDVKSETHVLTQSRTIVAASVYTHIQTIPRQMMRHPEADARKKCTVKRSAGNPERIHNRVPPANNVAHTPRHVLPRVLPHESASRVILRARNSPFFVLPPAFYLFAGFYFLTVRALLPFLPTSREKEDEKNKRERRRDKKMNREGNKKREGERERLSPLLSFVDLSKLTLSPRRY